MYFRVHYVDVWPRGVIPRKFGKLYPVKGGLYPVEYPVKISAKLYPVGYAKVPSHSLVPRCSTLLPTTL
jgi:hypothetical protein